MTQVEILDLRSILEENGGKMPLNTIYQELSKRFGLSFEECHHLCRKAISDRKVIALRFPKAKKKKYMTRLMGQNENKVYLFRDRSTANQFLQHTMTEMYTTVTANMDRVYWGNARKAIAYIYGYLRSQLEDLQ